MPYAYDRQTKSNQGFTRLEVIQALEIFLAYDTSWTVLQNISASPATGDTPPASDYAVFQKTNGNVDDDVVVHLWLSTFNGSNFGLNTSTGPFNASNQWHTQPGARFGTATTSFTQTQDASDDIVDYHFFGYPEYVYVVFLTSAGIWRSFAFGHIEKLSDFVGSGFACASCRVCPSQYSDNSDSSFNQIFFDNVRVWEFSYYRLLSQVRVDKLDTTRRYILGGGNYAVGPTAVRGEEAGPNDTYSSSGSPFMAEQNANVLRFEHDKLARAPSSFSLTAPLVPIYIYMAPDRTSLYRSLVGRLPNVFALNIKNIAETSEITVQADQYVVFPFARKTTSNDTGDSKPNSYYFGMALLKRTS